MSEIGTNPVPQGDQPQQPGTHIPVAEGDSLGASIHMSNMGEPDEPRGLGRRQFLGIIGLGAAAAVNAVISRRLGYDNGLFVDDNSGLADKKNRVINEHRLTTEEAVAMWPPKEERYTAENIWGEEIHAAVAEITGEDHELTMLTDEALDQFIQQKPELTAKYTADFTTIFNQAYASRNANRDYMSGLDRLIGSTRVSPSHEQTQSGVQAGSGELQVVIPKNFGEINNVDAGSMTLTSYLLTTNAANGTKDGSPSGSDTDTKNAQVPISVRVMDVVKSGAYGIGLDAKTAVRLAFFNYIRNVVNYKSAVRDSQDMIATLDLALGSPDQSEQLGIPEISRESIRTFLNATRLIILDDIMYDKMNDPGQAQSNSNGSTNRTTGLSRTRIMTVASSYTGETTRAPEYDKTTALNTALHELAHEWGSEYKSKDGKTLEVIKTGIARGQSLQEFDHLTHGIFHRLLIAQLYPSSSNDEILNSQLNGSDFRFLTTFMYDGPNTGVNYGTTTDMLSATILSGSAKTLLSLQDLLAPKFADRGTNRDAKTKEFKDRPDQASYRNLVKKFNAEYGEAAWQQMVMALEKAEVVSKQDGADSTQALELKYLYESLTFAIHQDRDARFKGQTEEQTLALPSRFNLPGKRSSDKPHEGVGEFKTKYPMFRRKILEYLYKPANINKLTGKS